MCENDHVRTFATVARGRFDHDERVESVISVPVQIRPAIARDIEQLCELAGELLAHIRAEGNPEDARRVFEHITNSPAKEIVMVAENERVLCGYAYASYK